jgi:DNA-binding response OmpR family regulator
VIGRTVHRGWPEGRQGQSGPARILIVENDYLVALDTEDHLTGAGFEVVGTARSAEEALAIATARRPALAIMDIGLAGPRDGVETAIELQAQLGVRSIFATAHADARNKQRAEPAHPLGWLQKPFAAKSLIASVKAALAANNGG